jgi:HEAT repeat protein
MTDEFAQELERIRDQVEGWSDEDNLHSLTSPSPDELDAFTTFWAEWDDSVRYGVASSLAALAEQDASVSFEPLLETMLDDEMAAIRVTAISCLWEVMDGNLARRMLTMFQDDSSAEVRAEAATALGSFFCSGDAGDNEFSRAVVDMLLESVNSDTEDVLVRQRALEAYAYSEDPYVDDVLRDAYESEDDEIRSSAVFAMGRRGDEDWLPVVHQELRSDADNMRLAAVAAASQIASSASVPFLLQVIGEDPDQDIRVAAVYALSEIESPEAERILQDLLDSDDMDIVEAADEALELRQAGGQMDNLLMLDANRHEEDFRGNGHPHSDEEEDDD